MLVDTIDSCVEYFYKQPQTSFFSRGNEQIIQSMIPCTVVEEGKHKVYVIPWQQQEIFACYHGDYKSECVRLNIEPPSFVGDFKLHTSRQTFQFSYSTEMFLAAKTESVYTKVITVNPYYILVNQSNYTILIEQAELKPPSPDLDFQLPIILEPGQKKQFVFDKINLQMPGLDEFLHIKLLDEDISGQDLQELIEEQAHLSQKDSRHSSFRASTLEPSPPQSPGRVFHRQVNKKEMVFVKHYQWSSPFMISEVGNFTLRIKPHIRKQRLKEQMAGLNSLERQLLAKIMNQSQYLRIKCKGDLRQAAGSMFVIIEEEDEATCKFKIQNESKYIVMHYAQHIVSSALWNQKLHISYAREEKCKPGQSTRFTWESLIHQNVLKASFSVNQSTLQADELLGLVNLSPEQEVRCLPSADRRHT